VHSGVRRFIHTAVAFLAVGVAVGMWMLVARELMGAWPHPYLVTAHGHAMLFGFVMFLILGVALWLFPRPGPEDRRYTPERIAAAYWLLLAGTVGRFVAEVVRAVATVPGARWVIVAGAFAQAAGLALYFWTMWGRIRPVGSRLREARGERF
jgi:heme/copper-type cytochrome/quinol oxidase subunit 1